MMFLRGGEGGIFSLFSSLPSRKKEVTAQPILVFLLAASVNICNLPGMSFVKMELCSLTSGGKATVQDYKIS